LKIGPGGRIVKDPKGVRNKHAPEVACKDDGGCEVAILSVPNARERAIRYADREYG